jgi:hypothetical protein
MTSEDTRKIAEKYLGTALSVSKPTKKENVLSFRKGHVFVALKLVTVFNKEKGEYDDPIPKITFLVDGKYVRMPIDSGLLKSLGGFLSDLGEVLEGVDVPESRVDVEAAKRLISSGSQKVEQ